MKIDFVSVLGDDVASRRLRIDALGHALNQMGHEAYRSEGPNVGADVYVFSKHKRPEEQEMALACKGKGKVVFDICDDHFQGNAAGHYLRMISIADIGTCSTDAMAERIYWYTGRKPAVIQDPYETPLKEAKAPTAAKRVLWHGHHSNLNAVQPLPEEYEFRVLCNKESKVGNWMPWSWDALQESLDWCDVVIIPQTPDIKNRVKTHNRATMGIRAGKFVIASPVVPEYEMYPIWLGEIEDGLSWAFANPNHALEKIKAAQKISETLTPEKMAKDWLAVCG